VLKESGEVMKVLILGAGIVGVTSAWYLAKSGHDVTIIDSASTVATESHLADSALISASNITPWTAPGIPVDAIKWLMEALAPLKINTKELDTDTLVWMTKMAANCNTTNYHINKSRMMAIAKYSQACLKDLTKEINIQYQHKANDTLQIFHSENQLNQVKKEIKVLKECGVDFKLMSSEECLQYEPTLRHSINKIAGGVYFPKDEPADNQLYLVHLTKLCKKLDVKFVMDTNIEKLNKKANNIINVATDKGLFTADLYLMALGSSSTNILANIGLKVPVYPMKSYVLSVPIQDDAAAPKSTIIDEKYNVTITRSANKMCISNKSEIVGDNATSLENHLKNINDAIHDLFPEAVNLNKAELTNILNATTPDGSPILGKTNVDNLYLNIGHGTLSWSMTLGTAKLISDIINEEILDIDENDFSIARYAF
jgi:D-amino-acid dehydrogenase